MSVRIVIALLTLASGCATSRRAPSAVARSVPAEAVSLLGKELYAEPPGADISKLEADLADARRAMADQPGDPERIVWVGRRLGYLWRMNEAIAAFIAGLADHPDYAPLYRHRGHRYLSLRRFDDAIADLTTAAGLIEGRPDEVELDGAPNERNVPLTTLGFNVWYYLGVARYCQRDFDGALAAFRATAKFTRGYDDNIVALADWQYMTLRRMGRDAEAAAVLEPVHPGMDIIENHAYFRRCLLYRGLIQPPKLLDVDKATELDLATLGYGLGNWHLCNGDREAAMALFRRVTSGPYWPAFGFIAAEADLAHLTAME